VETRDLTLNESVVPSEASPAHLGDGAAPVQPSPPPDAETAGADAPAAEPSCSRGDIHPDDLRQALDLLVAPDQTTELMLFDVQQGSSTYMPNYSGFYTGPTATYDALLALRSSHSWSNAFIRLNPVDPTLLSRGQLHPAKKGESATDNDILRRRWFYIDADPVRRGANGQEIKGIPSARSEFEAAIAVAQEILAKLAELGWPNPVLCFSGNGCHMLFRVDLPANSTLVQAFLNALKAVYQTRDVIVDTTVANPSRLVRLYGTANCKGESTAERPFRMSYVSHLPSELQVLTEQQLQGATEHLLALAAPRPSAPAPASASKPSTSSPQPNTGVRPAAPSATTGVLPAGAAALLDRVGLRVSGVVPKDGYAVHELEACACDRREAGCSVTVGDSGALGLHCHHASCEYSASADSPGQQWGKFRCAHGESGTARTDTDNAELLVLRHGDRIRYVVGGGWYRWDGTRWRKDEGEVVVNECAKETARSMINQAKGANDEAAKGILANARHCLSAKGRNAMIMLAARESELVILPADFNKDPWKLGVQNGTLDLRTGELHAPDRGDLISIVAPVVYDPTATAPLWQQFLDRVLPDREVQSFLQRFLGYALTGEIREHVIVFFHGSGRNGKSSVIETFKFLLGDYFVQANPKLLLVRKFEESPVERMSLKGRRLAVCAETGMGRKLAEDVVKALTGGDTINARALYKDEINFSPTHKLVVATNHLPEVSGTDEAIWSRILVVPFEVFIAEDERDPELLVKLRQEAAGILAWAVSGCLEWQQVGLNPPDSIRNRTAEHRAECDPATGFLQECCAFEPDSRVPYAELYGRYVSWCGGRGERPLSKREFSRYLRNQNCTTSKANSVVWAVGVRLTEPDTVALAAYRSTRVPSSTDDMGSQS
jgi:P4 family phage/plasmid primase-like protien